MVTEARAIGGSPAAAKFDRQFSASTVAGDPGKGQYRLDAPYAPTALYLNSKVLVGTEDQSALIAAIQPGQTIHTYDGSGSLRHMLVRAAPVPMGGGAWFEIAVQLISIRDGALPVDKASVAFVVDAPTAFTLKAPGDTATWSVSLMESTELWVGGTHTGCTLEWRVRRTGFGWTPVPLVGNRLPATNYSGLVSILPGTTVVGSSQMILGADEARVKLVSVESGEVMIALVGR